jgi:hypothetical protein
LQKTRFFKNISLRTNEKGRKIGMGEEKKCPLFRRSESLSMGKGIGYCDIDSSSATCEGDVKFCERPDALRVYLLSSRPFFLDYKS